MNKIFLKFLILSVFLNIIVSISMAQNKNPLIEDTTYVVKTINLKNFVTKDKQLLKILDTVIDYETSRDYENSYEYYIDSSQLKKFEFNIDLIKKPNNDSIFINIEYAHRFVILGLCPNGVLFYNNHFFFINGNEDFINKLFSNTLTLKTFTYKKYNNVIYYMTFPELPIWQYAYFNGKFYLIWKPSEIISKVKKK